MPTPHNPSIWGVSLSQCVWGEAVTRDIHGLSISHTQPASRLKTLCLSSISPPLADGGGVNRGLLWAPLSPTKINSNFGCGERDATPLYLSSVEWMVHCVCIWWSISLPQTNTHKTGIVTPHWQWHKCMTFSCSIRLTNIMCMCVCRMRLISM